MKRAHPASRAGFTLLEVVITAIILLMLAGAAVPTFFGALDDADEAAVRNQLGRLRNAVEFYSFQHDEAVPGQDPVSGAWSAQTLENQLRMASDEQGNVAAVGTAGYPFGPYLDDGLPENPYNGLSTVTVVMPGGAMAGPDDASGWVLFADTGVLRANSSATTSSGDSVWDL